VVWDGNWHPKKKKLSLNLAPTIKYKHKQFPVPLFSSAAAFDEKKKVYHKIMGRKHIFL